MSTSKWNAGRKASLLSSASGAVLLAGMAVMTPQQAVAQCVNAFGTVTCSGSSGDVTGTVPKVVVVPFGGGASYNLNIGTSSNTGTVQAAADGVTAVFLRSFNLNVTSGSSVTGGNGVVSTVTGNIVVDNKGEITGAAGDGIRIGTQAVVSGVTTPLPSVGNVTVTNTAGPNGQGLIKGSQNGISVFAIGELKIDNKGGIVEGTAGDGVQIGREFVISGTTTPLPSLGDATVTNTNGIISGGQNGISAFITGDLKVENTASNVTNGIISGTAGDGIRIGREVLISGTTTPVPLIGNATVSNTGGIIAGGQNGISAFLTGDLKVQNNAAGPLSGTISGGVNGIKLGTTSSGLPVPVIGNVSIQNGAGSSILGTTGSGIVGSASGQIEIANAVGGSIGGGTDAINVLSLLKDVNIENGGSIGGEQNGIIALALAGNVVLGGVDNGDGTFTYGDVDATAGTGVFAAAGGSVTIDAGAVDAGGTGVNLSSIIPGVDLGAIIGGATGVDLTGVDIGGGVVGIAVAGDAEVNLHGDVAVADGLFGGAAIALGDGAATVTLDDGKTIDPPLIGKLAATLGAGNATVNIGNGATVDADLIGAAGLSLGTGAVKVNVGNGSKIGSTPATTPLVGILTLDTSGSAGTEIKIGTGSTINGSVSAILAAATDAGATVVIDNKGSEIVGGGGIAPVIGVYSDSGNTINNQNGSYGGTGYRGTIRGVGSSPGDIAVLSAGGNLTLNNAGDIIGSVIAYTTGDDGDNLIDNQTGGTWTTSGLSVLATEGAGANIIDNATGATIQTSGTTVIAQIADIGGNQISNQGLMTLAGSTNFVQWTDEGINVVVNGASGVINATGLTTFALGTDKGANLLLNAGAINGENLAFTLLSGEGSNIVGNFGAIQASGTAVLTLGTEAGDNAVWNSGGITIDDVAVVTLGTKAGDNFVDNTGAFTVGDTSVFTLASGKGHNTVDNSNTFTGTGATVFTLGTVDGNNSLTNSGLFTVGDTSVFTLASGKGHNTVDNSNTFTGTGATVFTLGTLDGNNSLTNSGLFTIGDTSVFTLASGKGDNTVSNTNTFTGTGATVFSLGTVDGDNSLTNSGLFTVGDTSVFTLASGKGDNTVGNTNTFTGTGATAFTLGTVDGDNSLTNDGLFTVGDTSVFTLASGKGDNTVSNTNTFTGTGATVFSLGTVDGDNSLTNSGLFTVGDISVFTLASGKGDNTVGNTNTFTGTGATVFTLGTDEGNNSLTNSGLFTVGDTSVFTLGTLDGDNTIDNAGDFSASGTTVFTLATGNGDNFVHNAAGANFEVNGVTVFNFVDAGGSSLVENEGTFQSTGRTMFLGLDTFENSGLISMQNSHPDNGWGPAPYYGSSVGDVTYMSGNFNALSGSKLAIDAILAGRYNSASDLLVINGDVTGKTAVHVNFDPTVTAAYNPVGTPVVGVMNGGTVVGDFHLANGPIDRGLFTYDLFLDNPGTPAPDSAKAWVLANYADSSAYNLSEFTGLAQGIWNTTSDSWIDRAGDLRVSAQQGTADPTKKSGLWGRMIGSGADRSTDVTITPFADQSVKIDTGYNQTLWGFQAGIDHEFEGTVADGVLIAGVLGGIVTSKANFDNGESVKLSGPQVGVYASWVKGGLYVDGLVKGDFLKADYNIAGSDDKTDSTTIGVRVESGYRFLTSTGMFIEPNASLAYAHTKFDDINVAGTPVSFNNGDGLEGKLGARFGGSTLKDGVKYDPYVSVGIAGEMLSNHSVFFDSGPGLVVEDDAPDVFGEVGAGINIFSFKSGWTGFAKADLRFGDDYIGGTGKIGARWAW
ncbi:MAG: hypothetical protein P0Y66_11125 [Candidatus Kaistia colombiensis]|nr:MAG: hypothetical protein P0Y66_11125 [Kaistia sp.]